MTTLRALIAAGLVVGVFGAAVAKLPPPFAHSYLLFSSVLLFHYKFQQMKEPRPVAAGAALVNPLRVSKDTPVVASVQEEAARATPWREKLWGVD